MGRLESVFMWFIGIMITIKIILPGQQLSFFWLIIIGLTLFFSFSNNRNKKMPQDLTCQQILWWKKYQSYSYYYRQSFLRKTVTQAFKIGQIEQVENFLKHIIYSEPDNDTAQSLLIAIWSTEILGDRTNNA